MNLKTKKDMTFSVLQRSAMGISILGLLVTGCKPDKSTLQLPAIISNHMVLQQNSDAALWGKANPGSKITVTAPWGSKSSVKANSDSTWLLTLATGTAGGPFEIIIANDDSVATIVDVMVGEVWLASGQSNMEMPLMGWPPNDTIQGSAKAIALSANNAIRMFTVTRNVSASPLTDVVGSWQVSSPETSPNFSATAYFFARKLNAELNVPVGIIHSSWGGTPAESWIKGSVLANDPDFAKTVKNLEDLMPQMVVYNQWMTGLPLVDVTVKDGKDPIVGLDLFDVYCSSPTTDTQAWGKLNMPSNIESSEIGEFDGVVWLRKEVDIPAAWAGKELVLSLGAIDDRDVTYFNGTRVGGFEEAGMWQMKRVYTIPAELVKAGKAVVAVRVTDTQGGGGITGGADLMTIAPTKQPQKSISLAGEWQYRVVAEFKQNKLYTIDPQSNQWEKRPKLSVALGPYTATSLYNAMIAPLVPYGIKGAIWYQGEANVGRAKQYVGLMEKLIACWRADFVNAQMPFAMAQLAPWHYNDVTGISSAGIREAQRRTLSVANTGLVSTMDIGDVNNIHPCNKSDVGERFALWALATQYGKADLAFSGPQFKSMEIAEGKALLTFDSTNGGLIVKDDVPNQFEIAGADGVFVPATVVIDGNHLVVSSDKVTEPANVRYAFKNGSVASLFNGASLPAPSFTTESDFGY
jgi:sialate O-acetylesterase